MIDMDLSFFFFFTFGYHVIPAPFSYFTNPFLRLIFLLCDVDIILVLWMRILWL